MSTWLYTPCASVHVHKHPVPWITCIGAVDEADICTSLALAPNTLVLPIPFHKHFTRLNSYYSSVNLDTWLWMLSVISLPIPWPKLTQCSISLLTMYVKALYSNSHSCGPLYHTIYNIPFTSTIAVLVHQQSTANAIHMWATPYNNTGSVPEGMLWIGCHDTTTMEPHLLNVPMINSSFSTRENNLTLTHPYICVQSGLFFLLKGVQTIRAPLSVHRTTPGTYWIGPSHTHTLQTHWWWPTNYEHAQAWFPPKGLHNMI